MNADLKRDYLEIAERLQIVREQLEAIEEQAVTHAQGLSPMAGSPLWNMVGITLGCLRNCECLLIEHREQMLGTSVLEKGKTPRRKSHGAA